MIGWAILATFFVWLSALAIGAVMRSTRGALVLTAAASVLSACLIEIAEARAGDPLAGELEAEHLEFAGHVGWAIAIVTSVVAISARLSPSYRKMANWPAIAIPALLLLAYLIAT